jgi:hypothetical protein
MFWDMNNVRFHASVTISNTCSRHNTAPLLVHHNFLSDPVQFIWRPSGRRNYSSHPRQPEINQKQESGYVNNKMALRKTKQWSHLQNTVLLLRIQRVSNSNTGLETDCPECVYLFTV